MEKLAEDRLNRKDEAQFLINYLTKRYETKEKDSFVLNVNAKWGYGKTYFLKLLKKELKARDHEVIYFDAWANDFTKEPLLAFFSEINDSLEKYLDTYGEKENETWQKFKKSSLPILGAVLTKQLTGLGIDSLDDYINSEEDIISGDATNDASKTLSSVISKATQIALKEHSTLKKSIKDFKTNMSKILELIEINKKQLPLFILIDELDRCRPNYAIELLENIKHIFDIEGIYFIVATNSKQLSHSINAIYGQNFSSEIYLKRFFHQEYNLKEPDRYEFIKFLFEKEKIDEGLVFNPLQQKYYPEKNLNIELFKIFSDYFILSLRDIEQCINIFSTILITWNNKNIRVHIIYLVFFIMIKYKDSEFFDEIFKEEADEHEIQRYLKPNKKVFIIFQGKKYSIYDIISFYRSNINSNSTYISDNYYNDKYTIIEERNIITEIIQDYTKVTKVIKNYPNLVLSAAQLK